MMQRKLTFEALVFLLGFKNFRFHLATPDFEKKNCPVFFMNSNKLKKYFNMFHTNFELLSTDFWFNMKII